MRFHDLRHTFASLMITVGFPPYEVSWWLGNSNLATADAIYARLYPSDYASRVAQLEGLVAEGR